MPKRAFKKAVAAGFAAVTLLGCGQLLQSLEQMLASLEKGAVNQLAHDISTGILGVHDLTGGLEGLAPKLGGDRASVAMAPSYTATLGPGFSSAPGILLEGDGQCANLGAKVTIQFQKTDYPQSAEEKSADITVTQHCVDAGGVNVLVSSRVEADILYKDNGTGTLLVVEYAAEATDSNVLSGNAALSSKRIFPEGDKRVSAEFDAIVDTGGDWDLPIRDKTWSYGKFTLVMRNGTVAVSEVVPDEAIIDGEDMTRGTASQIVTHASGPVTMTTEFADITGPDLGTYDRVNFYRDGGKDVLHVESDGETIVLSGEGRDGFKREGQVSLVSGEYAFRTTFPAGHVMESLAESGTWRKGAPSGSYLRIITFEGGRTTMLNVGSIQATRHTLNANFIYEDTQDSIQLTGVLAVKRSPSATEVDLTLTNGVGDQAAFKQTYYVDGSSVQTYEKDIQSTAQNPDETGEFFFVADGSGSGTVIAYQDDGSSVTYTVTIHADTRVEVNEGGAG